MEQQADKLKNKNRCGAEKASGHLFLALDWFKLSPTQKNLIFNPTPTQKNLIFPLPLTITILG